MYLTANIFLTCIEMTINSSLSSFDLPIICCGTVVSWSYLRFRIINSDGTQGDTSPGFEFHKLFPLQLRLIIPY